MKDIIWLYKVQFWLMWTIAVISYSTKFDLIMLAIIAIIVPYSEYRIKQRLTNEI